MMNDNVELLLPRAFAYIVDALVIYFIMNFWPDSWYIYSPFATRFAVSVLYFSLMECFLSGSVGKLLVGLKVVDDADGDSASLLKLIVRNVVKTVSISFYFFSIATVPFFGRSIHDIAAKTDVDEDYEDDDE